MMNSLNAAAKLALQQRADEHRLRTRHMVKRLGDAMVEIDGRQYVDFSSNDYLGFAKFPLSGSEQSGSGASALVSGYSAELQVAESMLAGWKQKPAACILPSGYQANHAAVQTFAAIATANGRTPLFIADKLVHASLLDAVAATGATLRIFPHNKLAKLERLVADCDETVMPLVITESIYSMDGDAAPLREIAAMKAQLPFTWLLDEAHGTGLYGERGSGLASELNASDWVDIGITTFSKSLGLSGGGITGSQAFIDAVVNFGRAYIYSTAISPANASQISARIADVQDAYDDQRLDLEANVARLYHQLSLPTRKVWSPILPIVIGDSHATLAASQALRERGFLVVAIRPPTVAPGSSRLRVTVSCDHSFEQIDALAVAIGEILPRSSSAG